MSKTIKGSVKILMTEPDPLKEQLRELTRLVRMGYEIVGQSPISYHGGCTDNILYTLVYKGQRIK